MPLFVLRCPTLTYFIKLKIETYLSQFFAIFLFFKFLPCPINLDILFVTGDNLRLDLIGSIFSQFFLSISSLFFWIICKSPNLSNNVGRFTSDLFQKSYNNFLSKYRFNKDLFKHQLMLQFLKYWNWNLLTYL